MDRSDIAHGIRLFQYSDTARRGGQAPDLVERLWCLFRSHEIDFADLGPEWRHGAWRVGAGPDLRINTAYMEFLAPRFRLGALSLLLVHEGIHALDTMSRLNSELNARYLPIFYYRELSGPGVFDETAEATHPGRGPRVVQLPRRSVLDLDEQSEALRCNQLIDYVLSIETYTTPAYLTPQWIAACIDSWGGLANRYPATRGLYISRLAPTVDAQFTRLIPDIMESIDTRSDWNAMMRAAGPLRAIQVALDDLSTRPGYGPRVTALERRWDVRLREEPPAGGRRH